MTHPPMIRVLFLDDDADTRDMVTALLSQSNIDVQTTGSCGETLHLANTEEFDAFMLDGTNDGGSLRLCRILREYYPGKPIIFYTGMSHAEEIDKAMSAGASAYLVKPFFGDLAKVVVDSVQGRVE